MLKSVANCILLRYNQTIKRNMRRIIMEEKQNAKATEKVEKKVADKKSTTEGKKDTKKQETSKKDTNKKFEKIKGEIKKIDNRIIIGVAVAVVVLIAILACVFLMSDSPKKTVDSILSDLKSGKIMFSDLSEEEDFKEEAQKLFFNKLQWKIINIKEEGNTANVEIEITNKDFKTIMSNCMQKMFKLAITGQNIGEQEATNYLVEELKNDEIQTVTSNQFIKVEKKDGKWEIVKDEELLNILLPGFNEAISAIK